MPRKDGKFLEYSWNYSVFVIKSLVYSLPGSLLECLRFGNVVNVIQVTGKLKVIHSLVYE